MEVGPLGPERLRILPGGSRKWLRPLMGPVSGLEGRNDEIGRPLPPLSHRAEAITNAANGQSEHLSVFDQAKWSETGS